MPDSDTSLTLLESLREEENTSAWEQFDARYRGLLIKFARRLGLDAHEAEDAAQRTMLAFCQAHQEGNYDRDKGRFRKWLLGIAYHKISDIHLERQKFPTLMGGPKSHNAHESLLNDPNALSDLWEEQWRTFVMQECGDQARRQFTIRDMQIFDRLTLKDEPAAQVAEDFGLSPEAVWQVRHRVLTFMRSVRNKLENAL